MANIFASPRNQSHPLLWNKHGSFFWKNLRSLRSLFQLSTTWEIHNGRKILTWFSNWGFGTACFLHNLAKNEFPILPLLTLHNAVTTISDLLQRPLTLAQHTIAEAATLVHLNTGQDRLRWNWTNNATYTASSIYHVLITAGKVRTSVLSPWNFKVTPSLQIFCYLLFRDRLPTQQRLQQWNISFLPGCCLCDSPDVETPLHLFFRCSFSISIWQKLHLQCQIPKPSMMMATCLDTITLMSTQIGTAVTKKKVLAYVANALWAIWKERNARIFRQIKRTDDAVLLDVDQYTRDGLEHT